MTQIPEVAYTHAGKFHADDVFSAALLRILRPDIRFVRAMGLPEGFEGFAFDIGWGRFDHHQKDAPVRENGVPYAAFGLLWREFGQTLLGEEADNFDEHFIQPLDLEDNTGCGHPLAAAIAAFNPCWDSDEDPDQNFEKAVQVAHAILTRKIAEVNGIRRAGSLVRAAISRMQNHIVVLDRYAPWKQFAVESDAQFVVYPSQRGGFSAQGVPVSQQDNTLRLPFPESWAGQPAGELQRLSGIATLRFCHNNRFLISADTASGRHRGLPAHPTGRKIAQTKRERKFQADGICAPFSFTSCPAAAAGSRLRR